MRNILARGKTWGRERKCLDLALWEGLWSMTDRWIFLDYFTKTVSFAYLFNFHSASIF